MEAIIKKLILSVLVLGLFLHSSKTIEAEEDFSNTTYWTDLCTGSLPLTAEEKGKCQEFMNYMSSQSTTLKDRIAEIDSQREAISQDIAYYGQLVRNYQADADALNGQIADLNGQIAVKEKEIEALQAKIEATQEQIGEAEEKIRIRMVTAQETMRLNQYLDVIMGAKSFNDFIRIANGVSDITNYDKEVMKDLADMIEQLDLDKIKLQEEEEKLAVSRNEVITKQNEILAMKYQAEVVEQEYQKKAAELVALGNKYAADIEAIQAAMKEIEEKLNEVTAAAGWTYPVASGFIHPGAGTWHYASGGLHLGADFVANRGTALLAVGNGVILNSVNGCGDGYLGNGCVGPGGTWGGGNQIDALFKINGGLYAVKYSHMLINTPIPKGISINKL